LPANDLSYWMTDYGGLCVNWEQFSGMSAQSCAIDVSDLTLDKLILKESLDYLKPKA